MTSYISDQDLESLAAFNESPSPSTQTPATPSSASFKSVSFCPLALLIPCAPDGEKDEAVSASYAADIKACGGKLAMGVKCWTMEKPSMSPTKAFSKLYDGLSSSLQPLLSPTAGGHGGVCSSSLTHGSSPRTSHGHDMHDWSYRDQERMEERGFIPASNTVTVKLPGIKRNRSQSTSRTREGRCGDLRGILKWGEHCQGRGRATSLPAVQESGKDATFEDGVATEKVLSSSPTSMVPILLPTVSPTSTTTPSTRTRSLPVRANSFASTSSDSTLATLVCSISSTHSHAISTSPPAATALSEQPIIPIPIISCCPRCSKATEYGLLSEEEYRERWSKGAKRKRNEDRQTSRDKDTSTSTVGDAVKGRKVDELELCKGKLKEEKEDDEVEGRLKEVAGEVEAKFGVKLDGTGSPDGSELEEESTTPPIDIDAKDKEKEKDATLLISTAIPPPTPPHSDEDLPLTTSSSTSTNLPICIIAPASPPVSPRMSPASLPSPSATTSSVAPKATPAPRPPVQSRKMSFKSFMGGLLDAATAGGAGRGMVA